MKNICNWILNGKGRGKRYLLLLAIIFSAMSSFIIYFSWNAYLNTPQIKEIINSLPDLKLKDGVLIEPSDTYQNITWTMTNGSDNALNDYHIIIDTQNENNDFKNMPKNGIYLSRKKIYILNDGMLSVQNMEKIPNFEIKQGQLNQILEKGNTRFSFILFFTLSFILFITLYIWSLIYAVLSYFLTLFIPTERYSFAVRRRLSVVSLVCAYVLILPLSFWGFYTSVFVFFITVLVIMSLFLSCLPKMFIISVDK